MSQIEHWYLHVDLDAFFASVEQLDHPEYRGKPVIVGGKPEDRRGVVSTASYEARKYGVHSAMPTYQAYKLCPNGIYVHGRMQRYSELSYQIMNIFRNYSPDVDQMSIDEAFIDITGTEKLFGPPLEVAKKIKADVKLQTGLTVSVGIAPTKYLAKIASGYQKPDGITYIKQGEETSFMLSLPLSKIWGLGPKSLDLLRSKGIKTTRNIYDMPLDTLIFLFGNNMGNYLYDVVRGNEKATFNREVKTHSISAEKTFPYDLSDIYTIETELLEICHGVYFRLLKQNNFSRTAFIKIRYDDFSTVSAQVTLERNILTLDTYYETVKRLFETKYEKGRGIRLLGVGFDKIESEEKPYQQDLFENNDEKKQAVEKAILNLEKKHPEIKVRKARTFKAILILMMMSALPNKIHAQNTQIIENTKNNSTQLGAGAILPDVFFEPTMTDTNSQNFLKKNTTMSVTDDLFNTPMTDTNSQISTSPTSSATENSELFEYDISGYYSAEFTTGFVSSFGKNSEFTISGTPPVFKQEVEISLSALYNNHWFFEVDFADKFERNTFTMGYKDGKFLKQAKLSNRNIIFPDGYSAQFFGYSPQGGQNEAPGISLNFVSPLNTWQADFILRYDMSETRSATFYGQNKVTEINIDVENFMYGISYSFPNNASQELLDIKNIYVEDTNGTFTDANGIKYKQLSKTDYTILQNQNTILLSSTVGASKKIDTIKDEVTIPTVLVTFYSSSSVSKMIINTGSYEAPDTFAGEIQSYFGKKYSLATLAPKLTELQTSLENENALIIQSSKGFTPYLNANIYDCGLSVNALSSDEDFFVTSKNSGTVYKDFFVNNWQDNYNTLTEDFLHENHYFAKVSQKLEVASQNQSSINALSPESRFPFAQISPEIYLYNTQSSDLAIVKRTYSPISEYNIGSNLNASSVQVYVNGSLDNNATYNTETGSVILSSTPSNTDKIFITWQAESKNYSNGALTSALGLKYNWTPNLMTDFSLSTYWPINAFINSYDFTTIDQLKPGYAAFSAGVEYKTDTLTLGDKAALSITKENVSDLLLVSSKENPITTICNLSSASVFLSNTRENIQNYDDIKNLSSDEYIYTKIDENITLTSSIIPYDTNKDAYYIDWKLHTTDANSLLPHTEPNLSVTRYFSKADFSTYETINFDFYYEDDISQFTVELKDNENTALLLTLLNTQKYKSSALKFKTLTININNKNVYIDGELLFENEYFLTLNTNVLPYVQKVIIPFFDLYSQQTPQPQINEKGTFYIGNLYYKNSKFSGNAQNYSYVDLKKSFEYVDLSASLGSKQSITDFSSPNVNVNTNAKTELKSKYATLATDVTLKNISLQNAGHNLKTEKPLFSFLSLGDDFRYSLQDKSLSKSNNFALDFSTLKVPLKLSLNTNAQDTQTTQNQNAKIESSYNFTKQNFSLALNIDANFLQKTSPLLQPQETLEKSNYFASWKDISLLSFSTGKNNASKRTEQYSFKLSSSLLQKLISPSILFNLEGTYSSYDETKFFDQETIQFALPFTIQTNTITFNLQRNSNGETSAENLTTDSASGTYITDTQELFNIQNERKYIYTAIPFYELFSTHLPQDITQNYSTKYEVLYQRKLFNSFKDVYIPSSASFAVIRDIKSFDTNKDLYQYKTVITNTSLNNYGSDSINPIFTWFKQEEIISSLTGIVKVPSQSPSTPAFLVSGYIQTLFYINDSSTLTTAIDASFETDNIWATHETFIYSRKSNVSFIQSFAQFLIPHLQTIDFEISRKEIFNMQIGNQNNQLKQSYSYQHNVDHNFLKNYFVTTGLGGTFTLVENLANNLEIYVKLGFTAEF